MLNEVKRLCKNDFADLGREKLQNEKWNYKNNKKNRTYSFCNSPCNFYISIEVE